jgi:tRNA pseudouridine13 synthase
VLRDAGLTPGSFSGFGKLLQGTRRHNVVYPGELALQLENGCAQLAFTLPAGSYATVLLREILKAAVDGDEPVDASA